MLTYIWNVFIQSPFWMKAIIVVAISAGIIWEYIRMFLIGNTSKDVFLRAIRKAGSVQNLDSAVERFMRSKGYSLTVKGMIKTFVNDEGKTLTEGQAIIWFVED